MGLAAVPTWIAMREHEPVESDKTYGFEGQSDEETPTVEVLTKDGPNCPNTKHRAALMRLCELWFESYINIFMLNISIIIPKLFLVDGLKVGR
jgi:hypothetical protein